jgi:tetratricopeptide (TPR) repeat protein
VNPAGCQDLADRAVVERYLAGQLSDLDAQAFEEHYLTCATCQDALRLGAALRRAMPEAVPGTSPRRRVLLLAPLGLAASIAAVLLLRTDTGDDLAGLGAVTQPPIYLGVPVRSALPSEPDSLYAHAMTAYLAQRYPESAAGLRAALAAGVAAAPAEFFLGASLLMTDAPDSAQAAFARVIALGDTPYRAEAHYYRAKALLRIGRGAEALALLDRLGDPASGIDPAARALADSIRSALSR